MIVEGTAGNTGIGLTMVGNAKGYASVIVMPEASRRKKKMSCVSLALICGWYIKPYRPGNYVATLNASLQSWLKLKKPV